MAVDENGAFVARISVDKDLVVSGSPYDIVVSASGDSNYDVDTNNAKKLTVNRATVGIKSVEGICVTYGVNNTVIVTGKVDATGNGVNYTGEIKITINGKSNTANAVNGEFNVTIDGIGNFSVDEYKIEVEGAQTQNYNEIVKDDTKAILNVTKAYIDITHVDKISVVYGANNTLIITGAIVNMNNTHGWAENYTGNITVIVKNHSDIGATNSVNRDGTFTVTINNDSIANLTKGSYVIIVSTSGDANYTAFAAKEFNALEVEKAVVNVTSVSVDSIVYGANNTLVVNGKINNSNNTKGLADNYTGEVTVSIVGHPEIKGYSTVAIDGSFTITINNVDIGALNVGKYNFTVSTGGSDNYEGFSCEFEDVLEVVKADINVTGVSVDSVVYGANNTLVVVGSVVNLNNTHGWAENYVGRITVSVKGHEISNYTTVNNDGSFTVTIVDDKIGILNVDNYTLSIMTADDSNYEQYVGEFENALKVTQADVKVTNVNDIIIVYGMNNTITVTGNLDHTNYGANYTGTVAVIVENGEYVISNTISEVSGDGTYKVVIKDNNAGLLNVAKYKLNITLGGSDNYKSFNDAYDKLEVVPASVNVTEVESIKVTYGADNSVCVIGKLNATGYGINYTGEIAVYVNNVKVGSNNAKTDGSFNISVNVAGLPVGEYHITLCGEATDNYNAISNVTKGIINVTKKTIDVSNISIKSLAYGAQNNVTITGEVSTVEYGSNYTGKITVNINGATGEANALNGEFEVNVIGIGNFDAKSYDITVAGENSDDYEFNGKTETDGLTITNATVEIIKINNKDVVYGASNWFDYCYCWFC